MTARKRIHCSRRDFGDIQISMQAISIIISIVKYGGDPVMPWECFSSSETGLPESENRWSDFQVDITREPAVVCRTVVPNTRPRAMQ